MQNGSHRLTRVHSYIKLAYLECLAVIGRDRLLVSQYLHHSVIVLLIKRLALNSTVLRATTISEICSQH